MPSLVRPALLVPFSFCLKAQAQYCVASSWKRSKRNTGLLKYSTVITPSAHGKLCQRASSCLSIPLNVLCSLLGVGSSAPVGNHTHIRRMKRRLHCRSSFVRRAGASQDKMCMTATVVRVFSWALESSHRMIETLMKRCRSLVLA